MEHCFNIPDQLTRGVWHPSTYKFGPHLLAPCLSLQSLHQYDDRQSVENPKEKNTQLFRNLVFAFPRERDRERERGR